MLAVYAYAVMMFILCCTHRTRTDDYDKVDRFGLQEYYANAVATVKNPLKLSSNTTHPLCRSMPPGAYEGRRPS